MAEWSVNVKGVESCSPACPDLASLRPYRHEIVIYRTGEDGLAEEVSRGPVTGFDTQSGSVVIQGNDLLKWLARRVVHTDLTPVEPIDCTLLAMSVIADAMGVDPSPGLTTVFMGLTGVKVAPEIEAYNHYASDVLATLVQSGLAYRLRGRELLLGPAALVGDVAPTQTLRDGDFITPPKLSGLGDGQANGTYVKPDQEPVAEDGTELAPITGVYVDGAASDLDGRLERLVRDPGVVTQVDADTVAFNQTRDTMVTPMNVTANTLAPRAPVKMAQLVPGALWRAELAGCFGFGTVVRLTSLRVTASPGREAVEPACSPVGLVAP